MSNSSQVGTKPSTLGPTGRLSSDSCFFVTPFALLEEPWDPDAGAAAAEEAEAEADVPSETELDVVAGGAGGGPS